MFPESSTWRAEILRVTADGQRIPIAEPWAGYRWSGSRRQPWTVKPGRAPSRRCRAGQPTGLPRCGPRLGRRQHAARHRDPVSRSGRDEVAQHRRSGGGGAGGSVDRRGGGRGWIAAFDELARPPGEHASDGPAAGAGRSDRSAPSAARSSSRNAVERESRFRDTFYEPYASWYPELPTPLYVAVLCIGTLAAVAMTVGAAHPGGDDDRVRRRHLQPVLVDDTRAQQPRVPRPGAGGLGRGTEWSRLVARRLAAGLAPGCRHCRRRRPRGRCGCCASKRRSSTGRPGSASSVDPDWFGGSVTWHRVVRTARAAGVNRAARLGGSAVLADRSFHTLRRRRRSWRPSCSLPSGCGGGVVAMRPCGSPSASTWRSRSPPAWRCSRTWRLPRSSSGRCRRQRDRVLVVDYSVEPPPNGWRPPPAGSTGSLACASWPARRDAAVQVVHRDGSVR